MLKFSNISIKCLQLNNRSIDQGSIDRSIDQGSIDRSIDRSFVHT